MELRTHPMFVNLRKQVIGGKKQKKSRKVNREKNGERKIMTRRGLTRDYGTRVIAIN